MEEAESSQLTPDCLISRVLIINFTAIHVRVSFFGYILTLTRARHLPIYVRTYTVVPLTRRNICCVVELHARTLLPCGKSPVYLTAP